MSPTTKVVERLPKTKTRKRKFRMRTRKIKQQPRRQKDIQLKRSSMPRTMMRCPNCGSSSLSYASGSEQLWSVWDCKSCGFRGAFIAKSSRAMSKVRKIPAKRTMQH